MTVIGSSSKRVQERLRDLLAPFGGEMRLFDNTDTAETVKIVHNVFNAAKISFWNEIWSVCQALGIDHDAVATTVAKSAEASWNPLYGIRGGAPYGGVCLPKDTNGMLGFARELGVDMPLLRSVIEVNDLMAAHMAQELVEMSEVPATTALPAQRAAAAPVEATPAVVDLTEAANPSRL